MLKWLFLFISFGIYSNSIPEFYEVKNNFKSSDIKILDRDGLFLNQLRISKTFRTLDWIELEEISPALLQALLIAEDKNFYNHSGVDWKALLDGLVRYLTLQSKRGGSTISMQLVSFLNKELKPQKGGRNFSQKWNQIDLALELEKKWTKKEILEAYFNLAPFKSELIGIDSASNALFKKKAHGINLFEASVLVSFFKSPSGTENRIYSRACYIYTQIEKENDCKEIKDVVHTAFQSTNYIKPKESLAFHIKEYFKDINSKEIKTTLKKEFQKFAEQALNSQIQILKNKNVNDGAIILLDNSSGEILAYVGSAKNSISNEVDGVVSFRQAGSTLKPFIYGLAIEKNLITQNSIINDNPLSLQVGTGIYSPSNYQDKFHGDVTVSVALASSLNVPAVKVVNMLNKDEFTELLVQLGFTNLKESEFYGPSIALGSIDVNLKELTNAYRTLANKGNFSKLKLLKEEKVEYKKILNEETTEIISNILSDKEARALTFGLENPLVTKFTSSVKTGTSKDMRDNWCIGYNSKYTLGVWIGNFNGEPMWNVSGVTGAAPIWRKILNHITEFEEKNILGNASKKIPIITPKNTIRIKSPIQNTIYAIDPEIPEEIQSIFFETNIQKKNYYWRFKNKILANTEKVYFWKPQIGKHKLDLIDENNRIIETVWFEVR